ncbi:alpha-galactosidase [Schleiferilactobacillus harbinensis]|uniref:alpha-galactosidase n=1 Tax=Schleiferilactobacillus harbinensis TaxID=304207 RepID=UPI001172BD27|nr:alpha-galactosidase [Schleiferilactobacillus harbinensis]GEK06906.1 alpha-galactosidase [Schleiferilactobacillus harbinensis]
MITFDDRTDTFHLTNGLVSYVLTLAKTKYLLHRYWGPAIAEYHEPDPIPTPYRSFNLNQIPGDWRFSLTELPQELPAAGYGDFRPPALAITQANGAQYVLPTFQSYRIMAGKPELPGLPATQASDDEAETLIITLADAVAGVTVQLYYTIFKDLGIICRHQTVQNTGTQAFTIDQCASASLDISPQALDMITLNGADLKEAQIARQPLHPGIQEINSIRGFSSPQHQPFFALAEPAATEISGLVYAMHLVYSGNFSGTVDVDQFGMIRAQLGIAPDHFSWILAPGETFVSPEAVLNCSAAGLNGLSQNFHQLYRQHLLPKAWQDRPRPIVLNTWEAMYMDVSLAKIKAQAVAAAQAGIEVFVLDDGWFGERNDATSSLGDWQANLDKLPGGIPAVAKIVHNAGLKFGLWFEPEMISEKSQLYRQHPDWTLHVPGYPIVEGRTQYVLDLSRKEIQDFIVQTLSKYLQTGDIDYIKWDANRQLASLYSPNLPPERQGELSHRYMLGLYHVLATLTQRFPRVLFEGCCSGGGRFDPGMLRYMPQTWASDNTDPNCRMTIQNGFSLLYPPLVITAHVSASPNEQTGRKTALATRFAVTQCANLGYELDLTQLSPPELTAITDQISYAKQWRRLVQLGTFYRLPTPDQNHLFWEMISADQQHVTVLVYQRLAPANPGFPRYHLAYLDPAGQYRRADRIYGGDELMQVGLTLPPVHEDFYTEILNFTRVH